MTLDVNLFPLAVVGGGFFDYVGAGVSAVGTHPPPQQIERVGVTRNLCWGEAQQQQQAATGS